MIYWIPLILAAGIAFGLTWALYVEATRTSTLMAQLEALDARLVDTLKGNNRYRQIVSELTKENTGLWSELAAVKLERDIRQPAHPIVEYLARNGPTDMATLIVTFGRDVGRQLGELLTESELLDCDAEHRIWWAVTPSEARGRQTRVIDAMAVPSESHERPQEAPGDVPEWQVAIVAPDKPVERLSEAPSAPITSWMATWEDDVLI